MDQEVSKNAGPSREFEGSLPSRRLHLLEMEYNRLQQSVDKFDGQRFQVKNWTITTSGAVLALGASADSPQIVLAGILPVCFFAFLEIIYTDMQSKVIRRSNTVERLIEAIARDRASELPLDYRFGMGQIFEDSFKLRRLPDLVARRPHIPMFYAGLMAAMVLSSVLLALY